MKPLLLLHNRHHADDADMWRTAIRRGWETKRVSMFSKYAADACAGHDYVRYFGNMDHADSIKDALPIKFIPLDLCALARCSPVMTKRSVHLRDFGWLNQPMSMTSFVKPAREKSFEARVYKQHTMIPGGAALDPKTPIYVQDPVTFLDEVRCFCLNGEVLTSSYYRIKTIPWNDRSQDPELLNFDDRLKDSPLPQMARRIFDIVLLPPGVVMDFGLMDNGEWALIEFNEAWCSGLYYCDYDKCLDVVCASQADRNS